MRAEILKALEKRLLKQPLDQAELLIVATELQLILGYKKSKDGAYEFDAPQERQ